MPRRFPYRSRVCGHGRQRGGSTVVTGAATRQNLRIPDTVDVASHASVGASKGDWIGNGRTGRCIVIRHVASWLAAAAATLLCCTGAATAESAPTRHELWPEVQVQYGLTKNTDVLGLANRTRDHDASVTTEVQVGFLVTHRFDERFSVGVGYRYGFAPGGDPFEEHRLLAEQTIRLALPWDVRLSLRTREDLRWLNEGFSVRIRERVKVERDFGLGDYRFTPYASAELYYDTRFDAISRGRFIIGAVFPVTPFLSVDIYGARQSDWRPRTRHVNALGLGVVFSF